MTSRAADAPRISALVPHWRDEDGLSALFRSWPDDPRFELIVVDNGSRRRPPIPSGVFFVDAGRNLGFGGALNLAASLGSGDLLLLANPDARPTDGALDRLLAHADRFPEQAALVPRLESPDGQPQATWQLRRLPRPIDLLCHTVFYDPIRGPEGELAAGSTVEQPAAAALMLRRTTFERLGGLDSRFHPAWFEDVDLGRRLERLRLSAHYVPEARFVHDQGGSVPALGFDRFLPLYYHHLLRYLGKHHAAVWSWAARVALPLGMLARLAVLPIRCPKRASSRRVAARGLLATAAIAFGRTPEPVR